MTIEICGPMPPPDSKWHNPDPEYVRGLLQRLLEAGISRREAARRIGITEQTLAAYGAAEQVMPYATQYALECLAHIARGEGLNTAGESTATYINPRPRRTS